MQRSWTLAYSSITEGMTMEQYAGIDVSLESASVCVVDETGRIVREAKLACEPAALIAWFGKLEVGMARLGLEAGPLSQWLYAGMREVGLSVELLEMEAGNLATASVGRCAA